jgi:hypothetical protein
VRDNVAVDVQACIDAPSELAANIADQIAANVPT